MGVLRSGHSGAPDACRRRRYRRRRATISRWRSTRQANLPATLTFLDEAARYHHPLPRAAPCRAGSAHPCSEIVGVQRNLPLERHQVPEPWSGSIQQAPILFVSSNPSISSDEPYPELEWAPERVREFFNSASAEGPLCLQRGHRPGTEICRHAGSARQSAPDALSQRPSALAASTSARPGGRMRPAAIRAPTLATFTADQLLRGRRGVYRCRK